MAAPHPGAELVPYAQTARPTSFTGLITRDGSTGYAAEAGRYQLYASLACPWSHRPHPDRPDQG
jgi:glutathionyl-hydroquinone reductase